MDPNFQENELVHFLKELRDKIVKGFESLESSHRFERKEWPHHSGGGGEISLLRGDVFEKAAVNWSGVSGENFPLKEISGPFFATGISVITHMKNPHAPTVHMNIRYVEIKEAFWFGGGYDLTPMGFSYEEDRKHFHEVAKQSLDLINKDLYPKFSKNAKEYFYIPHWQKERGIGGIFFDHYATKNFEEDINMWKSVGNTFLDTIMPIYAKRIDMPYNDEDKRRQEFSRAQYAEFNLLYDRGTRFGFNSGGNPEAILCSMPPTARW